MVTSLESYIKVDGANIHTESAGSGDTVVLVHAGFLDSGMWDAQFEALSRTHHVVRYDQLGFGKSDPAAGPVSRHQELAAVLDVLGISRATIIGCSQGGTAALDFALTYPQKVASLILVSATPSGFEMQGEPPADMLAMFGAAQQGDLARVSELQIKLWIDGGFRQAAQVDAQVRADAARMNRIAVERGTFFIADAQPLNPLDPPAAQRLGEVKAPVLVIDGGLDHPELLRAADVLVANIRGARKLVIENAAHTPNMERPDVFNRAVLDFLQADGA